MNPTSGRSSRRIFSPQFKAKVALDAISCELTLAQLSQKYEVQASQITSWKRLLLENVSDISGSSKDVEQVNLASLNAKIGQRGCPEFCVNELTKSQIWHPFAEHYRKSI